MGYQKPALQDLQNLPIELVRDYFIETKKHRTNTQRLSYLTLLNDVTDRSRLIGIPTAIQKILLGAVLFEIETIYGEYYLSSPEGSDLYVFLLKKLGIKQETPMDDAERLIYLNAFYNYVSDTYNEETFQQLKGNHKQFQWTSKDALQKDIVKMLAQIRKRDNERISSIIHASPELDALRKGFPKLAELYRESIKSQYSFWQDSSREKMLRFVALIDDSCNQFYPPVDINKVPLELKQRFVDSEKIESNARKGAILFVLLKIYKSYKWFDPNGGYVTNGSRLFKECLNFLNVKDLNELTFENRIAWLQALYDHVEKIKHTPEYYRSKLETANKENYKTFAEDLDHFLKNLSDYKHEQETDKLAPSRSFQMASTVTSYAASGAFSYGVRTGTIAALGTMIATTVGGPPGLAIYAGGSLVATGLSRLIGNGIISNAVGTIYSWLLDKICDSIGDTAMSYVSFQYSATREGITELRSRLKAEDDKIFCDWINTLLTVPASIVNDGEKKNIRNVFGLEKDEKLGALPVKNNVFQIKNS